MTRNPLLILAAFLAFHGAARANWPQYLGPNRDGVSPEKGIARSWPAGGPKVLWTIPVAAGFGGPVISQGQVFILDRPDNKQDVLRCIDLKTGNEEWTFAYPAPGATSFPGSRSVPTVDGDFIYTCGSFGHVNCVDRKTHKPVWSANVWTDFGGGKLPNWQIAQSPLVYGDLVIIASQTEKAGVVAYDKKTGKVRWTSSKLPGDPSYVSPEVVRIDGADNIVMISGAPRKSPVKGAVVGLDPKDGKTLWPYEGWQCSIPIPNVTAIGDGRLFITAGYDAGSAMFKVTKSGDKYSVKELYKTPDFGTHVHPAILYKENLYGYCTTNTVRDGLVCMGVDGKIKWKTEKAPLFDKGGAILADGLILGVDGNEGFLYLIEPSSKAFKPLAKAKLLEKSQCWAPLALTDGRLLIRDQAQMKCVFVGKGEAPAAAPSATATPIPQAPPSGGRAGGRRG